MDQQNVIYTYNGILFSHKKEQNSDTYYNMGDLENIMLSGIKQTLKDIKYL